MGKTAIGFRLPRSGRALFAACALCTLLCGCADERKARAPGDGADRTYKVRRGDFKVAFRLEGQLDAIRSQSLRFDGKRGHGQLKLVDLLPDRSNVASNDVIFRLSDEWFIEQEKDLTRKLQIAEEDFKLALQDMEMIRADNLTELKSAVDALRDARQKFRMYEDGMTCASSSATSIRRRSTRCRRR